VKSAEEIMNMLEAFDLTESMRDAGELAGVSHHTVARYVAAREGGVLSDGLRLVRSWSMSFCPRSRSGSTGRRANCAPTSRTTSSSDSVTPARNGPPAARSRRSRRITASVGCGCTGRGSPSRGCGCSTTSATVR